MTNADFSLLCGFISGQITYCIAKLFEFIFKKNKQNVCIKKDDAKIRNMLKLKAAGFSDEYCYKAVYNTSEQTAKHIKGEIGKIESN